MKKEELVVNRQNGVGKSGKLKMKNEE